MGRKVIEICDKFGQDGMAKYIAATWFQFNSNKNDKIQEWKELRNYIFATDTSSTSNRSLPWKNSTTIPKLCQIRDNLHSNYISALFPNDDWLKWEGYSKDDATKAKVQAIEAYMSNKCRESHFRTEISKLVLDYIDYGNAFVTADFEASYRLDIKDKKIPLYIGPKSRRISPYDIVFNPLATSFKDSWKIVRSIREIGELKMMAEDEPDNHYLKKALLNRDKFNSHLQAYGLEDINKQEGMQIDGFGNYYDYLNSGFCEMLQFYGDIYNPETNTMERGVVVTVVDRMWVVDSKPFPGWLGEAPIYTVGWRSRPDNLWAMGPLDNLVGLQYRLDHLENLKSDAMDLAVLPPLVIKGDVEEFEWAPGAEIHVDSDGDVSELAKNVQWVLQCESQMQQIEQRMEMYAGAPREAMGIRTAGEKTAFEVQQLQNAAGRIFQEKVTLFETELLEPVLNAMLETARRNLDQNDIVRVMNDDLGVQQFLTITQEDITASGILRPIGARHFAAQAQLLQNLQGVYSSQIGQMIQQHTSSISLARLIEDVLGLNRWSLYKPNVGVLEAQETARLQQQAQEDLQAEQQVNPSTIASGQPPVNTQSSAQAQPATRGSR